MNASLGESQGTHEHFIDLCDILGEPPPAEADPQATSYCFEKAVAQTDGRPGRADVWKRGCFAWEYKGPGGDLQAAYAQLQRYAPALANPPLLIVSDMRRFRVHTNWTNAVTETHDIVLTDLVEPDRRQILKWAFADPGRLRPGRTRAMLTEEVAGRFATLADRLTRRGHDPWVVAHFLMRLVFCMFAEDVGLLGDRLFTELLDEAVRDPAEFASLAGTLFRSMRGGGRLGFKAVEWFNGGLFEDSSALPLEPGELALVREAARLDWADIDPTILGTLFERGLTPERRTALAREVVRRDRDGRSRGAVGVHYTSEPMILKLIDPVVTRPLKREWTALRGRIVTLLDKARRAAPAGRDRARRDARALYDGFLDRLHRVRVLDPACGSGNFLYLALRELKDLEHAVLVDGETFGFQRQLEFDLKGNARPRTIGPEAVMGIDVNPMGVELARISVWIGFIQWMLRHGEEVPRNPILKSLETIRQKDALVDLIGGEEHWLAPCAREDDGAHRVVIVGNPPFVGDKAMLGGLGENYVTRLRSLFEGRLPGAADLVCYWFEKARALMEEGRVERVGLVATNSIRGGANRSVLDRIRGSGTIFEAWSDEPWRVDGAAVRVSLVCFGPKGIDETPRLDGREVPEIFSDLSGGGVDLTTAKRLAENGGVCFEGIKKYGPFDVPGETARAWLTSPLNPNGRPNADVLRPWLNAMDVVRRPSDTWVIDFGGMDGQEAALYEAPFEHARRHVCPERAGDRNARTRQLWWLHERSRPELRASLLKLYRCIMTPVVAKHRVFVWCPTRVLTANLLDVIARDDDTTFGILHSRFHELWALRLGTSLEDRPRYTPSTTFETFPFPDGLTPDRPADAYADDPRAQAIAAAACRLNDLREAWLNPSDLVERVPEVVDGFPDRLLPRGERAATVLKTRTLTNLYNKPPAWLTQAHAALDAAVAAAYGWPADLSDEEALARLLALNHARTAVGKTARKGRSRETDRKQGTLMLPISGGKSAADASTGTETPEAVPDHAPGRRAPGRRRTG
ncbi:class I SAM-dependent DNA methyltransferase [Azospirillum sp. TSO35-2]|uniref:class I SAM-dependent DNA methyltransferase n=1 Tax=Azospirillum sp. TSO35-2 TaxID=716796 RepID=UPI001B3B9C54|nr:class I SAM-dependent DNA methyltransferase [Azospirillum sp. TSO35-2]